MNTSTFAEKLNAPYTVSKRTRDDWAKPWTVVTSLRSFNRVVSEHQTESLARRAAARRNRQHMQSAP